MRAVVAFPVLAEADGRKIDALRAEHDPNAARIAAHVTLVFPTAAIAETTLVDRVEAAAKDTAAFPIVLKRILVHQEGDESYLYLVPEQGYDALTALHARLNPQTGGPAFTPHVTVARLADRKQARAVATALATKHFAVAGRIDALTVVEVPPSGPVRTLGTRPLRG
jgi:2'-5' RNA ligase